MLTHSINIDKLCSFLNKPKSDFNSIINYNNYYNDYSNDKSLYYKNINNTIISNINEFFNKIKLVNGDPNYYIESICGYICSDFELYCSKNQLTSILKISNSNNFNNQFYDTFINIICSNIIYTSFLINNQLYSLNNIIDLFFNDITVDNKLILLNTLIPINKLSNIYNKLLLDDNVILKFLHNTCCGDINVSNIIKFNYNININIFNKIKLFFINKYSIINCVNTSFDNTNITNDLGIINNLIYYNNIPDYKMVLLSIKHFLFDINNNFCDNSNYQKISFCNKSQKYNNTDINNFNKNLAYFDIKYSNDIMYPYSNLHNDIDLHTDLFSCYYDARFPDRDISYDCVKSSIFVKTLFLKKQYCIHMSIAQYIILDFIITNKSNIIYYHDFHHFNLDNKLVKNIIAGFLKINLVFNYKSGFVLNDHFEHNNPTFSIYYLLLNNFNNHDINAKHDNLNKIDKLFDIVENYFKNNLVVYKDNIINELGYKINDCDDNDIFYVIELLIDNNKIKKCVFDENGYTKILYKYII